MTLAGRQLSIASALALCRSVGFSGRDEMITAVAVMCAESARFVGAYGVNDTGSIDRGLFQINNVAHPTFPDEQAFRAKPNARFAEGMQRGQGWKPWSAYNSGAYLKFYDSVAKVYDRATWRVRVLLWKSRSG